jgi:hypothetical protein
VKRTGSPPITRSALAAVQRSCSSARKSSAVYASTTGLPVSAVIVRASSSAESSRTWATRTSSARLSACVDWAHPRWTSLASDTISAIASGGVISTVPTGSSVAGSTGVSTFAGATVMCGP